MAACNVCFETYNAADRRPKVLVPCGHTFCLKCLRTMEAIKVGPILCPECKQQVLQQGAVRFVDNYALLSLEDQLVRLQEDDVRLYCLDCSKEASPTCIRRDGHALVGMEAHRQAVADLQQRRVGRPEVRPKLQPEVRTELRTELQPCVRLEVRPEVRPEEDEVPEQVPVGELSLMYLCWSGPDQDTAEKAALLERQPAVLRGLYCHSDPAWALRMLQSQAATLQQLQVYRVSREQLQVLQSMPHLRKLDVQDCQEDVLVRPALPKPWRGQLESLRVEGLPMDTVRSLITAQRSSLRELVLSAGTPSETSEHGDDWVTFLGGCGFERLRSVTLLRGACYSCDHSLDGCSAQLAALLERLPGCTVKCISCSYGENTTLQLSPWPQDP